MKKIYLEKEEIFEIAQFIKKKFPQKKFFIFLQDNDKLIIKTPPDFDYFQKEELKALLKTKYPRYQLNFYNRNYSTNFGHHFPNK